MRTQSVINQGLPTIHYTWIGPPPGTSGVAGHDIACVKMMAEKVKGSNPIVFWCLDEFKTHYEKVFENTGVKVQSVESLLNEFAPGESTETAFLLSDTPDNQQSALALKQLSKTFFPEGIQKATTRDKVTFKDLFTLFLLTTQGGYTVDTNIQPNKSGNVNLLEQEEFTIARVEDKGKLVNECFLMYEPQNEANSHDKPRKAFSKHFKEVISCEKYRSSNIALYSKIVNSSIISHLTEVNPKFLDGKMNQVDRCVNFNGLNLTKHYYSTHHKSAAIESSLRNQEFSNFNENDLNQKIIKTSRNVSPSRHQIFLAANSGNNEVIDLLVKSGEDVNRRSLLDDDFGATPLHYAIEAGKPETVKLLLELGADPKLEAKYRIDDAEVKKSALKLAQESNDSEILSLFKNDQAEKKIPPTQKPSNLNEDFKKKYPRTIRLEHLLEIHERDKPEIKAAKHNANIVYTEIKEKIIEKMKNGEHVSENAIFENMKQPIESIKKAYDKSHIFTIFSTTARDFKNKLKNLHNDEEGDGESQHPTYHGKR